MDNRILKQLYEKYGRELYLYLYSICGNSDAAEDLLQETFLKAILSLSEQHTNMRAWLYMVGRNLCLNTMKKDKRVMTFKEIINNEEKSGELSDVLEHIISNEKNKLLYQALSKLSYPKKEILIMQYFGRLKLKEIAKIIGLSEVNVRVLSCRGKKELKSFMEASGYEI